MSKQLHRGQSHKERSLSSPSPERLRAWRLFFESAHALAERILYSKSGFTRVVDRMEEAGLVRRVRPEHDRRSILVVLTENGSDTMERARSHHRDGIERHFSQHLSGPEIKALTRALEKISTHARPLRPGRIRG